MAGAVRVSNNFSPTVNRFRNQSTIIVDASMRKAITSLTASAQSEARANLKMMVYDAPLPRSVETGYWNEASYMAARRLGVVWKAILRRPPMALAAHAVVADVRVDMTTVESHPSTGELFYYAWVLNKGTHNRINYTGRPFWADMVRIMRGRVRGMGILGLKNAKIGLLGQTGWEFVDAEYFAGAGAGSVGGSYASSGP